MKRLCEADAVGFVRRNLIAERDRAYSRGFLCNSGCPNPSVRESGRDFFPAFSSISSLSSSGFNKEPAGSRLPPDAGFYCLTVGEDAEIESLNLAGKVVGGNCVLLGG